MRLRTERVRPLPHHGQAMRRGSWANTIAAEGGTRGLQAETRAELIRLDEELCRIWNLGDNVLLGWTSVDGKLLVLSVRHYTIAESVHAAGADGSVNRDATQFINGVLAGPKYLAPEEFKRISQAFDCRPEVVQVALRTDSERIAAVISDIVRCYGVSLVRNRAVVLLDAVEFSLQSPFDQMAMLNSLSYSVNSAYGQLLSKDMKIDFARTTTGDGFYIWNRATTPEANTVLYRLMMMILADNAVAQRKARSPWVPKLRAAFHVGEHYEFQQVEGINPTNFSYIVGQVTVDLARMLERALPGQILLGDFEFQFGGNAIERSMRFDTLDFAGPAERPRHFRRPRRQHPLLPHGPQPGQRAVPGQPLPHPRQARGDAHGLQRQDQHPARQGRADLPRHPERRPVGLRYDQGRIAEPGCGANGLVHRPALVRRLAA